MGYYTQFKLSTKDVDIPTIEEDISERISEISGYKICLNEATDDLKWYNHEKDMIKLSKDFPNTIFELYGDGEDRNDIWIKYFKNGKMKVCLAEIVIPEYDPTWFK